MNLKNAATKIISLSSLQEVLTLKPQYYNNVNIVHLSRQSLPTLDIALFHLSKFSNVEHLSLDYTYFLDEHTKKITHMLSDLDKINNLSLGHCFYKKHHILDILNILPSTINTIEIPIFDPFEYDTTLKFLPNTISRFTNLKKLCIFKEFLSPDDRYVLERTCVYKNIQDAIPNSILK